MSNKPSAPQSTTECLSNNVLVTTHPRKGRCSGFSAHQRFTFSWHFEASASNPCKSPAVACLTRSASPRFRRSRRCAAEGVFRSNWSIRSLITFEESCALNYGLSDDENFGRSSSHKDEHRKQSQVSLKSRSIGHMKKGSKTQPERAPDPSLSHAENFGRLSSHNSLSTATDSDSKNTTQYVAALTQPERSAHSSSPIV